MASRETANRETASRGTAGAACGPCDGSGRRRCAAAATGCSLGAGAAQVATTAAMAVVLVKADRDSGTAAAMAADRGDGRGEGMGHGVCLGGGWLEGFRKGKRPMPSACSLHTTGESMGALYGFPLVPDPPVQAPPQGQGSPSGPSLELQRGDRSRDWLDQWRRGFKAKGPRPRKRLQPDRV